MCCPQAGGGAETVDGRRGKCGAGGAGGVTVPIGRRGWWWGEGDEWRIMS